MAAEVIHYRSHTKAAQQWARMDRDEPVIGRVNGLPITVSGLLGRTADTAPSEYCAPTNDSA